MTISADDPRSIRAIEIAAEAGKWRRWHTRDGQEAFGIPSQAEPGRYYMVTSDSCECPDYMRSTDRGDDRVCKHILAVRLHCELVRAQGRDIRARSHLRVVR